MTFKTIALQLQTPLKQLERDSSLAYLEKQLHSVESDLLSLAIKYQAHSTKDFMKLIKQGKIADSLDTTEDFFKLDYLQQKRNTIQKLIWQV